MKPGEYFKFSAKSLGYGIKAMFFPGVQTLGVNSFAQNLSRGIVNSAKHLDYYQGPVQLPLIKADLQFWRDALTEAELPLEAIPWRIKMQQVFQDTAMNGHVYACMEKRMKLTLLKEYYISDANGNTDKEATELVQTEWFKKLMRYMLEKKAYGYSLITFGNIVDNSFPNLMNIRRWNVSPDREILSAFQYVPTGIDFNNPSATDEQGNRYVDWNVYVTTPTNKGVSKCGYGYLYQVALYEIILRNIIGWNLDFLELFGQPLRVGRTNKKDEEREQFEELMKKVGAAGWAVLDPKDTGDDIEFVEAQAGRGAGTGWMSYDNMEQRCCNTITKIILGHAAAMESTPGKIGAAQAKKENVGIGTSPEQIALDEIEADDSRTLLTDINDIVLPKLRNLGFKINGKFCFRDDLEQLQIRMNENKNNLDDSNIQLSIANAGGEPDWDFFNKRTGMNIQKAEVPIATGKPVKGTNTRKTTQQIDGQPDKQ